MNKKFLSIALLGAFFCSSLLALSPEQRAALQVSLIKNIQADDQAAAQKDYDNLMSSYVKNDNVQFFNKGLHNKRYGELQRNPNLQDANAQALLAQLKSGFGYVKSAAPMPVKKQNNKKGMTKKQYEDKIKALLAIVEPISGKEYDTDFAAEKQTFDNNFKSISDVFVAALNDGFDFDGTPLGNRIDALVGPKKKASNGGQPQTQPQPKPQQPTGGPAGAPKYPARAPKKPLPLPIPPRAMTQKDRDLKAIQDDYKKLQGLSGDPSKSTECNALKDVLDVAITNFEMNYGNQDLKAADGTALKINNLCPAPRVSPRPAPVPTPAPTPSPSIPSIPEPDTAIEALDAAAGEQKYTDDYALDDLLVNDFDPAKKSDAEQLWANIYSIYGKQTEPIIKTGMEGTLADLKQKYSLNVPDVN